MTNAQIKTYFKDHYHPENMAVFVTGKFLDEDMLKLVSSLWGKLEKNSSYKKKDKLKPTPRDTPYYDTFYGEDDSPRVEVGFKLYNISLEEEYAIRAFMIFLENKYRKELRNETGETYSVIEDVTYLDGNGYATLSLETKRGQGDYISNKN